MSTAVGGVNVIGKREDHLVVAVVVLESHFCESVAVHAGNVDHVFRQGFQTTLLVEIFHELADTALIVEHFRAGFCFVPLVGKDNADTGIQERLFPQPLQQNFIVVLSSFLENFCICLKLDGGTGFGGVSDHTEQFIIAAAVELLKIHVFAVLDGQLQPFRQGVYNRRTDTVQTAGNFISAAAELTAGMENGIHDSCRRDALFRVNAYRNTASVIGYANDIFRQNIYSNFGTESCQRLVNGVVYDLVDQVVQSFGTSRSNVHARTLSNRLQTFQHLNLILRIILCTLFHFFCHI